MVPSKLRKLVKSCKTTEFVYLSQVLYDTTSYGICCAKLTKEKDKLLVEAQTQFRTCREEFAGAYCSAWLDPRTLIRQDKPDITDAHLHVNPKKTAVLVLRNYNYDHLRRTIKVLNKKEKAAGWGTTSFHPMPSIRTMPYTLVIASRYWFQSVTHISLFTLFLRCFTKYPINMGETDADYMKRLSETRTQDNVWLDNFIKIHPKALELFMKNAKVLGSAVATDNWTLNAREDGVAKFTSATNRLLNGLRDEKDMDEVKELLDLYRMNVPVAEKFAEIIHNEGV